MFQVKVKLEPIFAKLQVQKKKLNIHYLRYLDSKFNYTSENIHSYHSVKITEIYFHIFVTKFHNVASPSFLVLVLFVISILYFLNSLEVENYSLCSTGWKFNNFSVTQNLREINYIQLPNASSIAILTISKPIRCLKLVSRKI